MNIIYSDQEIAALIQEHKPLPEDWHSQFTIKRKRGHRDLHLDLTGDAGNGFRIIIRKSEFDSSNFSVVLAVQVPQSNRLFRLRRYNGCNHAHTNLIENTEVKGFHIHFATERYQRQGIRKEDYAVSTTRYNNINGALRCLILDANFDEPSSLQEPLFEEV